MSARDSISNETVFIDWITASQHHPGGGLPIIVGGVVVWHDRAGNVRCERASPTSVGGSFGTTIRVGCDGSRVYLSGNPGRFYREDNVFNFGWLGTIEACNRILAGIGLPPFTAAVGISGDEGWRPGARLHRLDITANFSTGTEARARAVIRWLSGQSVARMKRGQAGDESCWWANSRHMFKAYLKGAEMVAHGKSKDDELVQWCIDQGIVRVEVELKRRLLGELGLAEFESISDEILADVFHQQTEILRRVDRSDDIDVLSAVPSRYRMTAAAWLSGQDVRLVLSRATLFRHAKVLRDYGLDIMQARNVEKFPIVVRVVDLQPVAKPDWYKLKVG